MHSVLRGMRCPAAHDKFVYEDYFEKGRFVMFFKTIKLHMLSITLATDIYLHVICIINTHCLTELL